MKPHPQRKRMKQARESADLSQRAAAEHFGASRRAIRETEARPTPPEEHTLERYSVMTGKPVRWFRTGRYQ